MRSLADLAAEPTTASWRGSGQIRIRIRFRARLAIKKGFLPRRQRQRHRGFPFTGDEHLGAFRNRGPSGNLYAVVCQTFPRRFQFRAGRHWRLCGRVPNLKRGTASVLLVA
ncbi:hypothetical protein VFPFJ_06263 [Purpureocillium lilacinum]|uniref:Uncharacterized protein n=1 Tax=Purpureocillium lilacinum TaxID=33203 RepID=A0A179HK49_PURLI|nr:hypothetical protein VFPFJ_06263 [Purpureocillium lilacinum]OAQ89849.1 hypothetical protein VFPFJ_06263 [Purpureocillium lilacinum]